MLILVGVPTLVVYSENTLGEIGNFKLLYMNISHKSK